MNYDNLNTMNAWEREKAFYLLKTAEDLEMDTQGYGRLGLNTGTGNVYLWLEDYNFTLFLPITCNLTLKHIKVLYSCPVNGKVHQAILGSNKLINLEKWVQRWAEKSNKKQQLES